eukprot:TRINITY_DN972_c0_g1_i2.p1 TRINITY_DN972_c0_g1~~TRINITY_DN972_c0_g1_i2.p1  ORF type:complete len:480 (+),score=94.25 TRINITY_DN972_c0_g1_i2:139-1578(+)
MADSSYHSANGADGAVPKPYTGKKRESKEMRQRRRVSTYFNAEQESVLGQAGDLLLGKKQTVETAPARSSHELATIVQLSFIPQRKSAAVSDMLAQLGLLSEEISTNDGKAVRFQVHLPSSDFLQLRRELESIGVGIDYGVIDLLATNATVPNMGTFQLGMPAKVKKKRKMFLCIPRLGRHDRVVDEGLFANIYGGNEINFDFIVFIITASIIAGAGLALNNAVVVVASMLVSPLMSPVLATCLGLSMMIGKHKVDYGRAGWKLVKKGAFNETIGLLMTVGVGLVLGLAFMPVSQNPDTKWLTPEQAGRGEPSGLIIGTVVAFVSGAAVAVAVSSPSGGATGLVGVAISASLLPPAVNAGMLFTYGIFGPMIYGDEVDMWAIWTAAGISLALAVVNIVVIAVVGTFFFKVRGIRPPQTRFASWASHLQQEGRGESYRHATFETDNNYEGKAAEGTGQDVTFASLDTKRSSYRGPQLDGV